MKNLIILFLVVVPFLGKSQVPGYGGKRGVVKAQFSFAPVYGLLFNNVGTGYLPNFNSGIQVEYVFSRRTSLLLNLGYKPIALVAGDPDPGKIHGRYIGTQYRNYSFKTNGSIAPYGRYSLIDLGYFFGNVTVEEPKTSFSNETSSKVSHLYIGIGSGKQAIIADNLVLDFGFTLGFTMGWRNRTNSSSLADLALRNIAGSQAFRLYLNVGGLIL